MTGLVRVENLTVTFGSKDHLVEAVKEVSFAIEPGECLAIVGESGSGKSVTARSLVGLAGPEARVTAGQLALRGQDLTALTEKQWRALRGREIGLVLQAALVALDPLRTVGDEVAEPLRLHRTTPPGEVRTRVLELLASVGIPDPEHRLKSYPHQLSGGQRQRVLIASALACDPGLLIADEPTTALDVTVQAQVLDLLAERKRQGTALLLISHDLSVVARLADRIAVMKDGRFVEEGRAEQVLSAPRHPYTRLLLDAVPGARTVTRARPAVPGELMLSASGLRKVFRTRGRPPYVAVNGVSFELRAGETLGVVGESGSGKTTTARIALGLLDPDAGAVELERGPWSALSERRRRSRRSLIQPVYQDPLSSFDPRQTSGRILAQALAAAGRPSGREPVGELLDLVGLPRLLADRYPRTLSGGQQQRIAIARALAPQPRVLVCDEPVSALDVSVAAQILDLFARLQGELGVAYLFISHHLGVIRQISDRVLVMKDGKVVESGPTDAIFDDPQDPYTRQLIQAIPRLDETVTEKEDRS